jgi:hypothetical protein
MLSDFSRKLYPQISMVGVDGLLHQPKVTGPLSCHILDFPFVHSFLILPSCPTCAQVSLQCGLKPPPTFSAHQLRGSIPGEDWQIDFIHMPAHKKVKYLLTLIDTFSGWVEAFPTMGESAEVASPI